MNDEVAPLLTVHWKSSGLAARHLDSAVERGDAMREPGGYRSCHPAGSTLADALHALGVPAGAGFLLMRAGQRVPDDQLAQQRIDEGDRCVLMPSIRAG